MFLVLRVWGLRGGWEKRSDAATAIMKVIDLLSVLEFGGLNLKVSGFGIQGSKGRVRGVGFKVSAFGFNASGSRSEDLGVRAGCGVDRNGSSSVACFAAQGSDFEV